MGGDSTCKYTVAISADNGAFSVVKSGLISTQAIITNLVPGTTYRFKILAKNDYGVSQYSSPITLLCAWVPG
jgi:hypothetical protein